MAAVALLSGYGYALAANSHDFAAWGWRFSLSGILLAIAAVGIKRKDLPSPAVALFTVGDLAAFSGALISLLDLNRAGSAVPISVSLLVAAAVETAGMWIRYSPWRIHRAFAAFQASYFVMTRYGLGVELSYLDVLALPAGLYLLWNASAAAPRRPRLAGAFRWAGLMTLLGTAFAGFYWQRGTSVHAPLLLVECIAVICWGLAYRLGSFVQMGTLFALAFVAVYSVAVAEIWTGLFSIVLGIVLLAVVFYVSVHQQQVRGWINRFSDGWAHRH